MYTSWTFLCVPFLLTLKPIALAVIKLCYGIGMLVSGNIHRIKFRSNLLEAFQVALITPNQYCQGAMKAGQYVLCKPP